MNKLFICILSLFTVIFCYYSENVIMSSVILSTTVIITIILNKINLFNPICWYVPFICIYHLSVVFADHLAIRNSIYQKEIVFSTALASCTSIILFTIFIRKSSVCQRNNHCLNNTVYNISKVGKYFFLFLSILLLLMYIKSGVTLKTEANLSDSYINTLCNYSFRLYILFDIILLIKRLYINRKIKVKRSIFVNFLFLLMSSLITGERDIFFCYILATIMVLINFSKINKSQILLLVVCALFLIPISSRYKNILYINDDDKVSKSAELPIIAQIFFSGEFLAGGRNLETILQYEEPKRYGMSLINDITRAIIPPFIVQVENSVGWFAYKYHYNLVRIGQGLGFSIIAEGYLNFGFAGIFLWFTVISIIIIVLHNKTGNQYVLLLYVFMIPNFIYAIRGDFSTILSPMVKQIIIPIIFLKIISYIYYETIISNRRS